MSASPARREVDTGVDRSPLAAIIAAAIRRKNLVAGDPAFQPLADAVSRPEVVQEVLTAIAQAGWILVPPRKKLRRADRDVDSEQDSATNKVA